MNHRFRQTVQPLYQGAESELKLILVDMDLGARISSMRGNVVGPYSTWGKTLTAEYPLYYPIPSVTIPEPVYWTPHLPLLYRVDLSIGFRDGARKNLSVPFGFRRWGAYGASFRLSGERVVLRGVADERRTTSSLVEARKSESTLLVRSPGNVFCAKACRHGVALVVDLRDQVRDWTAALRRLAWYPAVMLVLVDDDAPSPLGGVGGNLVAANVIKAGDGPEKVATQPWISVLAVELQPDERPPSWIGSCGKPVVAIRRGANHSGLLEARADCDRLQADLAPAFNLAGYFVARD